ncbi:MAG TPA: hypothetical protein VG144_09525 [Gaiellaceae bacterium]|nr:hypothetical protein [Gaiellaceae bacterium]
MSATLTSSFLEAGVLLVALVSFLRRVAHLPRLVVWLRRNVLAEILFVTH